MCRLVGWISDTPRTLADVLGRDALERFVALSAVHQNGWGMSWLRPDGTIESYHSTQAARNDPHFAECAETVSTTGAIAHLRWATPSLAVAFENTHPFIRGEWALAHNGAIWPNEVLPTLTGDGPYSPAGTTDSEALFCGVRNEMSETGASFRTAFEVVTSRGAEAGLSASSLNVMAMTPDRLHVVNWHNADSVPELFAGGSPDDPDNPPYYDLRHLHRPGLDVAASSGFVTDAAAWDLLPPASLLTLTRDASPTVESLCPRTPLCRLPESRKAS